MKFALSQFLPLVIFLVPMILALGIFLFFRNLRRRDKRSPLTANLLRSPGEGLAKKLDDMSLDFDCYLTFSAVTPLLVYSMYLSIKYVGGKDASLSLFLLMAVVFWGYCVVKLILQNRKMAHYQLGLDCERSVGQELNQLMLDGYRVFHDIPADGFNIDHVVVGGNGLFAIETKGRPKPDRSRGQEDAKVTFDGTTLKFPTWSESKPLSQAESQATWLRKCLTDAVGEQVDVQPILMLPGWFIDRKSPKMLIHNGKNVRDLFRKLKKEAPLQSEMIQRISYQIEQRCRDVEPVAYNKKKKK